MKKFLNLLSLIFALPLTVNAAPFLTSDPYPLGSAVLPDTASFTVNGGASRACTILPVSGGLQPKCDLASITTAGTYTLVLTVTAVGGITNGAAGSNTATNQSGGSSSAVPFTYILKVGNVAAPTGQLLVP